MLPTNLTEAIDAAAGQSDFAVFDFDETCIKQDIGESLSAYLAHTGHIAADILAQYDALLAQGKVREAYTLYGSIVAGLTEAQLEDAVSQTIEGLGGLTTNAAVVELMEYLKQRGVAIWIVSASHEVAVRMAARSVGIEAHIVGIKNNLANGVYMPKLQDPTSMLEGKVECMRAYINPAQNPLLVIDDSPTGLPILETANIKVVVNKDPAFVAQARANGWFIL